MLWIYKCNARKREYQRAWGDWSDFFASGQRRRWGSTRWIPKLERASRGDTIIAYQTDRNELVGTARVVCWQARRDGKDLILQPLKPIGVRVRPLKDRHPNVARIPALQPGPIRTLYPISLNDGRRLLRAAGSELAVDSNDARREAHIASRGAGFGSPEENKRVERSAVKAVTGHLRRAGWSVRDVSSQKIGYDLLCKRKGAQLHVEVKGARGATQQFLITGAERESWLTDRRFALAFVAKALSGSPILAFFHGSTGAAEFVFRPISYVAVRRSNGSRQRTGSDGR